MTTATEKSDGKHYPDGHGGTVFLPLGDISFADAGRARNRRVDILILPRNPTR